ncbi:MAG TPA: helix-turn-helix domain-containing protein [Candidatus Nanoarchaeia archaeon]|nr:helix-turn-helix domain-containing protein [Candidatus Nanoarchaeia archaeon]
MKDALRKYGLSEKEIGLYLACLKTGSTTANRLSELTNIRRSTVYEVIDSLKHKGLISSFIKNKRFYFSAAKPSILLDLLKDKEKLIRNILPELNQLSFSLVERPKVEVFEGLLGLKTASEDMLDSKEILVYGASHLADKILGPYTTNFSKRRVGKKIKLKAIIEEDIPDHMKEKEVAKYTSIKTSKIFKNHTSVYFIYSGKVLIITFKEELMALRITSPLLVESQKILFDYLWNDG